MVLGPSWGSFQKLPDLCQPLVPTGPQFPHDWHLSSAESPRCQPSVWPWAQAGAGRSSALCSEMSTKLLPARVRFHGSICPPGFPGEPRRSLRFIVVCTSQAGRLGDQGHGTECALGPGQPLQPLSLGLQWCWEVQGSQRFPRAEMCALCHGTHAAGDWRGWIRFPG